MSLLYIVLAVIGGVLVLDLSLGVLEALFRAVCEDVPLSGLSRPLKEYLLRCRSGGRAIAYNRATGTMIEVAKTVISGSSRTGAVALRVIKSRVLDGEKFRTSFGRFGRGFFGAGRSLGPYRCRFVPKRRLPSGAAAQTLAEMDCGSSLSKVCDTIEQMVCGDPELGESAAFAIWCENCSGGVYGTFEEGHAKELWDELRHP